MSNGLSNAVADAGDATFAPAHHLLGIIQSIVASGSNSRIALPGKGKSGSTRTLVAHQMRTAIVFLVGREKSQPGGDFSVQDEEAAKVIAAAVKATEAELFGPLVSDGFLMEICNGKEDR